MPKTSRLGAKFAANMRARRKALGMTQQDLAARMGKSQSTINDWENGRVDPLLSTVEEVAIALGLPEDALLTDSPALVS